MRKRSNRPRVALILPVGPNRDAGAPVSLPALGIEVPVGRPFEMVAERAEEALRRYPDLQRYVPPAEPPAPVEEAAPAPPQPADDAEDVPATEEAQHPVTGRWGTVRKSNPTKGVK